MPVINSGGQTYSVTSGQIDSGDVLGGGSMFGLSGGEAETTVAGGGSLTISAGGTDSGTQLASTEVIGGLDIPATVSSGATVTSGGTAGAAIVPSDGTLIVNAAGVAANAAVIAGGPEIVGAGGEQDVYATAKAPVIAAGSQIFAADSSASGTMVSGGVLKVASGGLADPAFIASGGNETVIAGGIGAEISEGTHDAFGFASGAFAFTESQSIETGSQAIESGRAASSPTIESGGLVLASSGCIASSTGIDNGGFESGGGNWTGPQADHEE